MPETISPPGTVRDPETYHGLPASRAQAQISATPMQRIRNALKLTGDVSEQIVLREAAEVLEGKMRKDGTPPQETAEPVTRPRGRPPGSKNRTI